MTPSALYLAMAARNYRRKAERAMLNTLAYALDKSPRANKAITTSAQLCGIYADAAGAMRAAAAYERAQMQKRPGALATLAAAAYRLAQKYAAAQENRAKAAFGQTLKAAPSIKTKPLPVQFGGYKNSRFEYHLNSPPPPPGATLH